MSLTKLDYKDYVQLNYQPKKDELIAEFRVEPAGVSMREAAGAVAAESSIGTWTGLSTLTAKIVRTKQARVFDIDGGVVKIAYPQELFEKGNMPQILSSVAGNVFGMKIVNNLRLEDIRFPKSIVKSFKGPKYGIPGIRKLLRIPKRPLCGTIIKPKLGLNAAEHAKVAYNAWHGFGGLGIDIVKDDENLSSMTFNGFEKRVVATLKARDKAERETGERKIYMPNITAESREMMKRAAFVKKHGGRYVMIDILTAGYSALQMLRESDTGLVIHAHRAGHAMLTRNKRHGMSMLTVAKISRLIGVDQLHIGTAVGKMEGPKDEVMELSKAVESGIVKPGKHLGQEWFGVKPVFSVCSGGLHPGHVPALVGILGHDIIIQCGGGVHGHPRGTAHGACALRQAINAVMLGKTLHDYAKSHAELAEALEHWKSKKTK